MMGALMLFGDVDATLAMRDRTEARVRQPGTRADQPSMDVETAPEVRLVLSSRRSTTRISYTPRLTFWDLSVQVRPLLLHGAAVDTEWREGRTRLSLREDVAYGGMSFGALTATPGTAAGAQPRVDVIPTGDVLQYASSTTTLGSRSELRRWSIGASIGYQLSGGADETARATLPWQRGPLAEASVGYSFTRIDRAVTLVTGQESEFTSGSEVLLVTATEAWRHRFSRWVDGELAAGASEVRTRAATNGSNDARTLPVAEASLEHRSSLEEGRVATRVTVRLGPVVNRLIGLVDERIQGRVEVRWSQRRLGARASLSAAETVPTSDATAIRLAQGEVALTLGVSDEVAFDTGIRELWQRQAAAAPAGVGGLLYTSFTQSVVFVGVTFRAPDTRL